MSADAETEITLGDIAKVSPESLLYVLGRQIETLTGGQRLDVYRQLRSLAIYMEDQPEHAEAIAAAQARRTVLLSR